RRHSSFLLHSSLHAFSPSLVTESSHLQPKPNTSFLLQSSRITLCVTFHPRFTTSPPPEQPFLVFISTPSVHRIVPVEINIGSMAKFDCETEDAPNVSFKWFKDGHPIKEGDKYRIISRFSTSSLEVLSPSKDDSGEYTCKASNQHGSDECSASLSVTG
uniref:Ig-like domain-containing protein n=1 Tax=Amphiprion percula TaxID=161767 RepID=A0A3P8SWL7_AMPPE